ncbi:carbon-nitrogen hydrolase family protein [Psychrobacillus sp. OK032]|uniref:carbon-nitrogen hydrolase family protein n=1 Tax=Psychrobacillus sp. OK032 TaxID=1884358 RepID=UPI0008CB9C6C|nr:carbon-nitrogen hydrolase family protein [Psychrobacillus sp. OK032]SER78071.1 Predicted amidohydrolase [Psychrobacillus sp. OK032]
MSFQIVMAQLGSSENKQENLEKAEKALRDSTNLYGADMVVFPEAFMSYFEVGTPTEVKINDAEPIEGPFVSAMSELASKYGVWVVFGMRESTEDVDDKRVYNSTVVINSSGLIESVYRKTHLYDAFGGKESDTIKPGDALFEPIDTPFGKIGLFVCYELRFPEIARHQALNGADILIVPSGWVKGPLKEHHWENLVTTRAIENTVYVVACDHVNDYYMGQSMVVDPMGVVIAKGNENECLIPCRIDLKRVQEVRKKLPSYIHRQPSLYKNAGIYTS